jgi:phosphate transport system protein
MSIRKQYDSDLEALKTALVEMGQNAAEAVENALEALCTADTAAAQKIVQGDDRINNMERDIEHRCMTLLLRQQPVASDLRKVSTALKMVTDVERIGDQASDIAELVLHLHAKSTDALTVEVGIFLLVQETRI